MFVKEEGATPCPQLTSFCLNKNDKKMQNVLKRKMCIWKDFKLFKKIIPSKSYVLDHSGSIDMHKEK